VVDAGETDNDEIVMLWWIAESQMELLAFAMSIVADGGKILKIECHLDTQESWDIIFAIEKRKAEALYNTTDEDYLVSDDEEDSIDDEFMYPDGEDFASLPDE
jgi:hypothetical protein